MITDLQRQVRKQYAGSSDAPAICGIDDRRSPADVWLVKTGHADGFEGNDATQAGNFLEPSVLDWAGETVGGFSRQEMVVADCGLMAANFDGIQPGVSEPFVVEAKTTGITGPPDKGYGEITEGENIELPERVLVQVHHQMFVAGIAFRIAYVPVLIGGTGFRMYRVARNDVLANTIAEECRHFMGHFVKLGIRPTDFRPSLEVLKRIRREPNKTVDIPDAIVDRLVVARAAKKQAEDDAKEAETAVLTALGDAEAARYGGGTLTYFEIQRKAYSVEAGSYRSIKIKANKEKQ